MLRFLLIMILFTLKYGVSVRVCKTFDDYYNKTSTDCINNPDGESNATQVLMRWGCNVSEHILTTDDGYRILVIRAFVKVTKDTPIVLAHGISMNSFSFISMFNKTLAYNLIKNGYQIFLINFRGSTYSAVHSTANKSYWNFSFHQMGIYDIPTTLKFVSTTTQQKAILVGYSMGTTASFIYSSTYPNDASKHLKGIVCLAPIYTFRYAKTTVKLVAPFWPILKPALEALWKGIFPVRPVPFNEFCASGPQPIFLCNALLVPVIGEDLDQIDPFYAPVTELRLYDQTALKVLVHYAQIIIARKFRQYDYGTLQNFVHYKSFIPPSYDISKISVPIALYAGQNDWLASTMDAAELYNKLHPDVQCGMTKLSGPKFNHLDMICSKDMNTTINPLVLEKIAIMESGSCLGI